MIYRDSPIRTSAEFNERLALVISKRPGSSEFAGFLFSELSSICTASHAVVWRLESESAGSYKAEFTSCRLDEPEQFFPAEFDFFQLWLSGSRTTCLLENKSHHSLKQGKLWTSYNWLLPLCLQENPGFPQGILSLHFTQTQDENSPVFNILSTSLAQIIANMLLTEQSIQSKYSLQELKDELWFEHGLRLLLSRLQSRLDRDYVLQTAVDTIGLLMKVSSCLILRREIGGSTRITHEFVDTEISPLGLGSSTAIPRAIAEQMLEKTTILEETGICRHEQESSSYLEAMESLFESSIHSLAGTPIVFDQKHFGALIVQSRQRRKWLARELQFLELAAQAIAVILKNVDEYQQAVEQVFNLSLLSKLTKQLGSAVEQLGKTKSEEPEEINKAASSERIALSSRELEVLRLIASGFSNREIAQRLFLTESTVELHASRIRKKLKLKSRTALVKFACDNQLV